MSEFQSFDNFSEDNSADNTTSSRHARAAEAADGLFHHDDAKHDGKKHGKRNSDTGKKPSHKSHGKSHKKNDRDALEIEPQAAEFSADEISHDADRADLTFEQLGVPQPIVDVIAKDGKVTAFPIQADTLPDSLSGRDILGRGRTGSGNTLAFAIPLVTRLGQGSGAAAMRDFKRLKKAGKTADLRLPHPRGMVLAPTRELVNQIDEVIQPLAHA